MRVKTGRLVYVAFLLWVVFCLDTVSGQLAPVSGTATGIFINPSGGVVEGVGTDSFRWGVGDQGSSPSSLTFTSGDFQAGEGELFSLGRLSYFNGTLRSGTEASSVDLQLTITVNSASGDPIEIVERLRLVNTTNTGDPKASADRVFLPTTIPIIKIDLDDVPYILEVIGFGNIGNMGGGAALDEFFVLEGESESADLIGRISCGGIGFQVTNTDNGIPLANGTNLPICYKLNMSDIMPDGSFTMGLSLLNPYEETLSFGVCSMANRVGEEIDHPIWVADGSDTRAWSCVQDGTYGQNPSYHFGCRNVTILPGQIDSWFDRGVMSPGLEKLTPYVDFLRGTVDSSCFSLGNGVNQFLWPSAESQRDHYVNAWAIMDPYQPFPSKKGLATHGCSIAWPVGNWFTMGSQETFRARLEGTIIDAPKGATVTFDFPEGSPELQRSFVIPPADSLNPTCQGARITISEPFIIPPTPAGIDFTVQVPEECAALREGARIRFSGQAVGDVGSPEYESGEFIVGHDGTCLVDNTPPQTERVTTRTTSDGFLDVRVAATDAIAAPLLAVLQYEAEGQAAQSVTMGFADPPMVGDTVYFRQTIGPFPDNMAVDLDVNVFDDASNPTQDSVFTVITSIEPDEEEQGLEHLEGQVFPNPFTHTTAIQVELFSSQAVVLEVYDMLGRRIDTIIKKQLPAGKHRFEWDAANHASGLYFVKIKAGDEVEVQKVILVR